MIEKDLDLWTNITFKTQSYRKNFDFVNDNENIITECEGAISETRIAEQKSPFMVGEYGLSVWNLELGRKFGADIKKLIAEHSFENTYEELANVIKKKHLKINDVKKLVLIHTLILHQNYRKRGIFEEFVEMIYRDFYDDNTIIIALVKPFQDNPIDADYYFKRKFVQTRETVKSKEVNNIPAIDYYSLHEFTKKNDTEINEYKLFSLVSRCGFNRINESHLFQFFPEKTIERMMKKLEFIKTMEKHV
jgi:hypothetical protein